MAITTPALTARNHMLFWSLAFAAFIGTVWLLDDIMLPFVLGLAIAYLLNPLVEYLGARKIPRAMAAIIILGLFAAFIVLVVGFALPPLYRETAELAAALPGYIDQLWARLAPYIGWAQEKLDSGGGSGGSVQEAVQGNIGNALKVGTGVLTGLASGGKAFISFLSVSLLTPIVAYFVMKEWPTMTNWIDKIIPRGSYHTVKDLLRQIDRKLAGFVRGQITVAFVLAVAYAIALTIAGLKFGFLIGLMAGILSIVPLVGSTIGLLVSVGVAWFQSGEWSYVGIIAGIFLVGQFIEGNFLSPKLLGKSVGIHPLWILFALFAGGSMFGIVGMLLAVPVAAVIGVLLGFAILRYKNSPYYEDHKGKK